MRRDKAWWARLTKDERSRLVWLECCNSRYSFGHSGFLPDDCYECPSCSQPSSAGGLCTYCATELDHLVAKGNGELQFSRGEQVAYIPMHANGDINHPDVEFGFVTSQKGATVFCRYWYKGQIGMLRTTANSEGTPADRLVRHEVVRESLINLLLDGIEASHSRQEDKSEDAG